MEIRLESLSGNNKSAKVGKINVLLGQQVENNTIIMQLETKKGNSPLKAKDSYKIEDILVHEGDEVKIGDVLFIVSVVENESNQKNKFKMDYLGSMIKGKKESIHTDLTVIGAGPGGYVAAIYAAKKGLNTIIIEKEELGGTCLNVGCIPTKALVKSSEVFNDTINGDKYGVLCKDIDIDMRMVLKRKDNIKENLISGIEYLLEKNKVKIIKGTASFINNNNILVKKNKDEYTINSRNIIISTGSQISKINIPGIDLPFVLNSTTALSNENKPKSITIVGGGVIGMEFAFIYSNFGIEVNVVEFAPKILSMLDKDVSDEIQSIAEDKGIKVYTNSKVTRIEKTERRQALICFEENEIEKYLVSENVLVAIGREPNLEGIDIEKTSIQLNKKAIKVDEFLSTNVEGVYAIGDVNGKFQLAHVASHEAIVAVENILGNKKKMQYDYVPNVIFTTPEIASVGLTEEEAIKKGLDIKVSKIPFASNGKALTMEADKGFIKMIKDIKSKQIIGASIVGPEASSLISALTLIVNNKIKEEQIVETIFPHPTTGEVIHEAALGLGIGAIHFYE